jgi:hypothetical protein
VDNLLATFPARVQKTKLILEATCNKFEIELKIPQQANIRNIGTQGRGMHQLTTAQ